MKAQVPIGKARDWSNHVCGDVVERFYFVNSETCSCNLMSDVCIFSLQIPSNFHPCAPEAFYPYFFPPCQGVLSLLPSRGTQLVQHPSLWSPWMWSVPSVIRSTTSTTNAPGCWSASMCFALSASRGSNSATWSTLTPISHRPSPAPCVATLLL